MKFFGSICLGLLASSVFAESNNSSPDVYIDVSKKAQLNAIKYDGWKFIGGLNYSMSNFKATITGGFKNTEQNVNNFMLTTGIEWSKKFQRRFIIGVSLLADIWKAQKKTGDWQIFNYDFYDRLCNSYIYSGSLDGELKSSCIIPELSVKGGYIFRNMGTIAFLKLGLQYIQGEYSYLNAGLNIASAKAIKIIPLIGIGGYRRFNKKWGMSLEVNFPFRRETEKTLKNLGEKLETFNHKIKMGRKSIRILATYSISR